MTKKMILLLVRISLLIIVLSMVYLIHELKTGAAIVFSLVLIANVLFERKLSKKEK